MIRCLCNGLGVDPPWKEKKNMDNPQEKAQNALIPPSKCAL